MKTVSSAIAAASFVGAVVGIVFLYQLMSLLLLLLLKMLVVVAAAAAVSLNHRAIKF